MQVELNTIASSFGCLSTLVSQLHAFLMERAGRPPAELARLPPHDARAEIADAIAAAVRAHGAGGGAVLMVVQPGERNAYDQYVRRRMSFEAALDGHGLRSIGCRAVATSFMHCMGCMA